VVATVEAEGSYERCGDRSREYEVEEAARANGEPRCCGGRSGRSTGESLHVGVYGRGVRSIEELLVPAPEKGTTGASRSLTSGVSGERCEAPRVRCTPGLDVRVDAADAPDLGRARSHATEALVVFAGEFDDGRVPRRR